MDLAALNIHRARDHGILSYNGVRLAAGLPMKNDFSEVTSNRDVQDKLAAAYETVDDCDPWVCGIRFVVHCA